MRTLKKEYGLLIIAFLPVLNLIMQQLMPNIVNKNQMTYAFFNIFSVSVIVFYTIRKMNDKNKNLLQKFIVLVGFFYSSLIVLLLCSLLLFNLQK